MMYWSAPELIAELEADGTTACRIASDRFSRVERFADTIVISFTRDEDLRHLLGEVEEWLRLSKIQINRIYSRRLVLAPGRKDVPELLRGDAPLEPNCEVRENGMRYEVDFTGGYSCGFFIDQRENRSHLRELNPQRVLNTFSYTCSFSVVAASVGAATLSIDLARVALERGRRNFLLNGLVLDGQRFIADDVRKVLPRLARRGDAFDAIILDPPTFSRGSGGKPFQVESEMASLLEMALDCAAPGASILLSTNCSSLTSDQLHHVAETRVPNAVFHEEPPLPDVPQGDGASTLWMKLP